MTDASEARGTKHLLNFPCLFHVHPYLKKSFVAAFNSAPCFRSTQQKIASRDSTVFFAGRFPLRHIIGLYNFLHLGANKASSHMSYRHAERFYIYKSNSHGIIMQTIKYAAGIWNIEATIQKAGDRNRLAVISAMAGKGNEAIESKHTVVFEHMHGCDEVAEAKACVRRLLLKAY
jgi:hypothetical protein